LIQKDKGPLGNLGAHMEKCIFIGYPQGYKGWKIYNPLTKQVLILERADFDEHFSCIRTIQHLSSHPLVLNLFLSHPPLQYIFPLRWTVSWMTVMI